MRKVESLCAHKFHLVFLGQRPFVKITHTSLLEESSVGGGI